MSRAADRSPQQMQQRKPPPPSYCTTSPDKETYGYEDSVLIPPFETMYSKPYCMSPPLQSLLPKEPAQSTSCCSEREVSLPVARKCASSEGGGARIEPAWGSSAAPTGTVQLKHGDRPHRVGMARRSPA